MFINNTAVPKSSFLSTEKDMELIVNKIFANKRIQKYLYYTTKDPLSQKDLTDGQVQELFEHNISLVPKLKIDPDVLNYINVTFNNFTTNDTNPEFRDCTIELDIICHYDQWAIKDFQLRPIKIAAELDSMLDKQRLTGIGKLEFMSGVVLNINQEFGGFCLTYRAVHGEEDKKDMIDPVENEEFIEDFKEMIEENGHIPGIIDRY